MLQLFITNAPDPPHYTLNSCFGVFCCVWVISGPFQRLTKLGSKRAELVQSMQKFMPRIRIGNFRNKRTLSTPLDPNLTFCCILWCLGASGIVSSPYETRLKTGRTGTINAKVRAVKSC